MEETKKMNTWLHLQSWSAALAINLLSAGKSNYYYQMLQYFNFILPNTIKFIKQIM